MPQSRLITPPKTPFQRAVPTNIVPRRKTIAAEVQNFPADNPGEGWRGATRALVIRELLLQEARRLEVPLEPQTDKDGRVETSDDALVRALRMRIRCGASMRLTTAASSRRRCKVRPDTGARKGLDAPRFLQTIQTRWSSESKTKKGARDEGIPLFHVRRFGTCR